MKIPCIAYRNGYIKTTVLFELNLKVMIYYKRTVIDKKRIVRVYDHSEIFSNVLTRFKRVIDRQERINNN